MRSGGRNESNSHQLAGIGEKKIFHELDVHHVTKVGIKRSCTQKAEMSRTAMSSHESAKEKFLRTRRTSCLERRIKRFWPQEAKMSLTAISSLESARKKFFMNWLRRPK